MSYTVYMHTCPNGKKYIGITMQYPVTKRWQGGNGYIDNQHFYRAIKKYGWCNIEHKIMSNWHTQEEAENLERHLIETFKTNDRNYGYNKTSGGEKGKTHTAETIEKIRKYRVGKKASKETINKLREIAKERYLLRTKEVYFKKNIRINQYTLNGDFVKEWSSIKEASIFFGRKRSSSGISHAAKGKRKTAYGYKWEYAEEQT